MSAPVLSPRRAVWQSVLRHPVVVPVAAVAIALVIGALVMVAAGIDPFVAYGAVVVGALEPGTLDYTVSVWSFVCGMALAAAIPLRAGEFNLGGNGQLVVGGLAAYLVAVSPLPDALLVPVALIAAVGASGAVTAVSGPLSTRLRIPVIISTLLLSPVAVAVVSYAVRYPLAESGSGVAQTPRIPDAAHLPTLPGLSYSRLGVLLIVIAMIVYAVVDRRTAVGWDVRMLGQNPAFAASSGVRVPRVTAGVLAAGGAAAGLVGAIIVLSPPYRLIDGALISPGYTFAGLAAALLAGARPGLIPVTAVLFTVLQVGGAAMERSADVPRQLSDVIQGVVIVVLALRAVLERSRTSRSAA